MRALVRDVSPSFANALCATPPDPPIDLELARRQHATYVRALIDCGVEVTRVVSASGSSEDPDGCFVEDTAVVAGGAALISRPGAPSRRNETIRTAFHLSRELPVFLMKEPATLDGGDVMRVGTTIFVGRSARTNEAGIARLVEVFEPRGYKVVPVAMPGGVLHLKSACAPLGDDRITLADGSIPREAFGDLHVVRVPIEETYAANCLALGDAVLAAKGYPRTCSSLVSAGFRVIELDTSEFRKADGALTCLSILF